ncbi:unnamed protein product [Moneuplotes crassus]|uniref:Uncharacterized protein n=1 Tax=Euplotes crassus TaxID=5936 RepID=A0AAD1XAN8_EUPCR|nr:unnamed protein product [Moneuplotes crassus]
MKNHLYKTQTIIISFILKIVQTSLIRNCRFYDQMLDFISSYYQICFPNIQMLIIFKCFSEFFIFCFIELCRTYCKKELF